VNGLRQGDVLACLLLNVTLEKILRDSGIQTSRTIFYKPVQLLAYANDLDLISRAVADVMEAFLSPVQAAEDLDFKIL
jgi:sorting nexin-29